MKISWVNKGEEFEIPKVTVEMELNILEYMDKYKDIDRVRRNVYEFVETIYMILNKIDKNVTREMIKDLDINELGEMFGILRSHGKIKYTCPHCKKTFAYSDMPPLEGDKNFRIGTPKDTMVMKDAP